MVHLNGGVDASSIFFPLSGVTIVKVKISDIKVKSRIREEIGDLGKLSKSMEKYGLINPVTITERHELVAGFRRLEAARKLGWESIDCHIVPQRNKKDKLQMEADENTTRKDFTPDEVLKFEERMRFIMMPFWKKMLYLIRKFFEAIRDFFLDLFDRVSSKKMDY